LGCAVPGGNKYRNLNLQVGGVSEIEIIKYAHESQRLRCPAKTENYRPNFSSERASNINKLATI
jgi:hypothetical protein